MLALLIKASMHQTAGGDNEALFTLLNADKVVSLVPREDCCLREALRASVLSEIG